MEDLEPDQIDTIVAVGDRVECPYYSHLDSVLQDGQPLPWCTRFQMIVKKCGGDINKCEILTNAPDPRDGYR